MIDLADIALLKAAASAAERAYAPYSRFSVGAALLAADGCVFVGCNVENASYGLTICAERSAVFSAVSAGVRDFSRIAIVASGTSMPYPCGACRQVLAEFCGAELEVLVAPIDQLERREMLTLGDLLPHAFELTEKEAKGTNL